MFQGKDVFIPEAKDAKLPRVFTPPEFIRNVWGRYHALFLDYLLHDSLFIHNIVCLV